MTDQNNAPSAETLQTSEELEVQPLPLTGQQQLVRRLTSRLSGRSLRRFRASWPRLAVVALAISFTALAVMLILLNSPLLQVKSVTVEGTDIVSAATVRQLAGLKGDHVILADLEAARQRVATLPMVRDVTVSRDWPNGIKVVIVERTPWGRWRANNTVWAIDSEGVILEGAAPQGHGPIVTQVSALPPIQAGTRVDLNAVHMVAELHARGAPLPLPGVVAYEWSMTDGLVLITEHGRIIFGDSQGLDYKYAVWDSLEREAQRRGEPLLFADLRFGLRPRVEIGLNIGRGVRIQDRTTAVVTEQ